MNANTLRNKKSTTSSAPLRLCEKKSGIIFAAIFLLNISPAFTQNAAEIDAFLATDAVSYEQAAWLILKAAEMPDFSGPAEAFKYAADRNWLPASAALNGKARLDGVSLLIMQSNGLKGGIMYSLTKSPRYAYRELLNLNIIQGRVDPEMTVSGDLLLFMVNRLLSLREEEP